MDADLNALLELQERDDLVTSIETELEALDPEVQALDAELANVESELVVAQRYKEDAGARRNELEGKIETYRLMQERRRQQLEWVSGAKEAATLMAELDMARSVLAKEEAEWIRSANKLQEAERRASEIEEAVEGTRSTQVERRDEIAMQQADCRERLAATQSERDASAKNVNRSLLSKYERIRRGRSPRAAYPLHGNSCGHCFTVVPMHRRQQIQSGDPVTNCEACGVLVFVADA